MLWSLVLSVLLVTSIVDERSKALDNEYEELMGEKLLEGGEATEEQDEKTVGKFNPREDLHNEEYKNYANGEPYMMKQSKAKESGYVCQQFTLPTNEGVSLELIDAKDLNACKCACNELRGEAEQQGKVGCNAFAYLAGQNVKSEANITVNECHMKKHFMYHEDWLKVVNPWIFCVQEGAGAGPPGGMAVEAEVATSIDHKTVTVATSSALLTAIMAFGLFHCYYKPTAKSYLLLDDEI